MADMTKGEAACVSLKEHFEARFAANEKALVVATADMERRLSELNQLRKDVITDRAAFVTQELYNTTERERALWREQVAQRLTVIETRSVTWTAALGIFFTIFQVSLSLVLYWALHK